MKKTALWVAVVGMTLQLPETRVLAVGPDAVPGLTWPSKGWPTGTPASVGLDEKLLKNFDMDIVSGKYRLVDSFRIFRCGKEVFAREYAHDYKHIYAKEAKTKGPLNRSEERRV